MSTAAPFGEPEYQTQEPEASGNAPNGSAGPEEVIDINDPRLTSENLTFNPEGDAYAIRPTLPAGKWRAKFKVVQPQNHGLKEGQYSYAKKNKDGQLFLVTNVEVSVIDHSGKYDDYRLTDYYVATEVRKDGTMQAATLLNKLGKPVRGGMKHAEIMGELLRTLAAEPEAGVEVEWEWSCQKCEEQAQARNERKPRSFRGMHNFPQVKGPDGKTMIHDPQRRCDVVAAHGTSVARPRIMRYLALGELAQR